MSYRMNITRQNKSQLHFPFAIFIYLLFLGQGRYILSMHIEYAHF